jgi:hypothetical protein
MENNYKEIMFMNKLIKILQYLSESNSDFNKRIEFIKNLENKNIDWKEAIKLSRLWYCITIKKCKYSPEIYNKVKNLMIPTVL